MSVNEILNSVSNQMKANEEYSCVVLSAYRVASSSPDSTSASSINVVSSVFEGRPGSRLPCVGSHAITLLAGSSRCRWQCPASRSRPSFTFSDNFGMGSVQFRVSHVLSPTDILWDHSNENEIFGVSFDEFYL